MIEPILTMYGTTRGLHTDRQTRVIEQVWWRCIKCDKYFKRREDAERHARREHSDTK